MITWCQGSLGDASQAGSGSALASSRLQTSDLCDPVCGVKRVVGLGEALRGGQVVLGWNHDPGSVSVREYGCHLRTMYGELLPLA